MTKYEFFHGHQTCHKPFHGSRLPLSWKRLSMGYAEESKWTELCLMLIPDGWSEMVQMANNSASQSLVSYSELCLLHGFRY